MVVRAVLRMVDVPGIVLFSGLLAGLLAFPLSLSGRPLWPLLLVCDATTPVSVILAIGVVLGLPNGFNNLGLQAALYKHAPAHHMGAASGQFQTFRYVGAILSTSLLGLAFSKTVTSTGLHLTAYVLACISGLLLVAIMATRRWSGSSASRAAARGKLSGDLLA